MDSRKETRWAGILMLAAMLAGIFSVAPSVDSADYLVEAAKTPNRVTLAAIFQFAMSLAYVGIAVLLYPSIKKFGSVRAVGFLGFRIMASTLSVMGTVLLLSILALSDAYAQNPAPDTSAWQAAGNLLKTSRDHINHGFMVLVLCTGNLMFYTLLFQSKPVPRWLSVWGMAGAFLSAGASVLFLFRRVDIITPVYLALNAPTALHELALGIWFIAKGFDKRMVGQA